MKIGILGIGGIGGLIGAHLELGQHDVTLMDLWPTNVDLIKTNGLKVTSPGRQFTVKPKILHLSELSTIYTNFDCVFMAVKSYDTLWATTFIKPYLAINGFIVSAQNSINEDAIASIVGWSKIIGCVVTLSAAMYKPAQVIRTSDYDKHAFTLGEPDGSETRRLKNMCNTMSDVGISKITTNLLGERWSKLAINCMSNALAGITGLKSAELRENSKTRRVMIQISAEVVNVATTLGVPLETISGASPQTFIEALNNKNTMVKLDKILIESGSKIGTGRPSLAQDLMKSRRTEIDHLNGYVSQKGKELGVPTPINDEIVKIAKLVETKQITSKLSNINKIVS